jgi:hypothetical protein
LPNRILRAELLDSEPWLALKDNADRCAWIACVLTVDNFGDMPAGPQRLVRLWRPYGIDTPEKAAKVFADLVDVDLVRSYECDGKPYLHIPRFQQHLRFIGHVWPISPWATNEEKQRLGEKSPANHIRSPVNHREPLHEVEVEVEVEVESKSKDLVRAARRPGPADPLSKPPKPVNRGTRLPHGWQLPDDWQAWAEQVRPDWTPQGIIRESITFRDYWLAKSGANGSKMDWLATWRNWIRRCETEPQR